VGKIPLFNLKELLCCIS